MKKIILPVLFASALFLSCSDDDSSGQNTNDGTPTPTPVTADYIPLDNGNYWVYDVQSQTASGRDSLYISGTEVISGKTYNKFITPETPFGFFSNSLYTSGLRQDGDKLLLTGNAQFFFSQELPVNIAVSDFIIFKESAANGEVLGSVNGTLNQIVDTYNLQVNYMLSTKAKETLASYTIGGKTYSDVKKVETVLNLKITSPFVISGVTYNATVMNTQDVVVSTQYYAKNIGVVHVETDISYNLVNVPGVTLPVPQSFSDHQEEVLEKYS